MTHALEILFEDKHVVVANKPANILTVANRPGTEAMLDLVRAHVFAKQADGRKGYLVPVHFLDYPVSGAVMFAASSKAAARLAQQFRERRVTKIYHAAVAAVAVGDDVVTCEDYLSKDEASHAVSVVDASETGAKHCVLTYRAIERGDNFTVLEVRPLTGRSHQIRVQLASRGMPIIGDQQYNSQRAFVAGIALHAAAIEFEHPVLRERITVHAPRPPSWAV